ncbi:MAG: ribosome recycling factor [Planctomycetaceae bacterium]
MTQEEILFDAEERMEKAASVFKGQLQGLRVGRATPGLVDSVRVLYFGSPTPLKQMANISCPEPQQIVIRPFDATQLGEIVKAIQASDAGMAPINDGKLIRINVPPLSTERRKEMVHRIGKMSEEARVAIRNVRRDANKHADQAEKDKLMTEDECKACKEEIQNLTKKYEGDVNDSAASKEKEIMQD